MRGRLRQVGRAGALAGKGSRAWRPGAAEVSSLVVGNEVHCAIRAAVGARGRILPAVPRALQGAQLRACDERGLCFAAQCQQALRRKAIS